MSLHSAAAAIYNRYVSGFPFDQLKPDAQAAAVKLLADELFGEPGEWKGDKFAEIGTDGVELFENINAINSITLDGNAITPKEARRIARRLIELADELEATA